MGRIINWFGPIGPSGYGRFTRSIQLPFPVEADRIEANYEKGILKIWLPRAEADKPRKIVVKSNS